MSLQFSETSEQRIEETLKRYPTKQAALLPVFWIAQEQFGWISQETIELIAHRLDLSAAHVYGVATFYTMLLKKPAGKYHLQVCRTLPCALMGCDSLIGYLKERLGIEEGETTDDKKFTLTTVECLASCGTGPAMMVNEKYYENLTCERAEEILNSLK
ncbi:MAG: NADH-quinone oxidoreductase subunit NuoE [Deltaproteobacteria bacterium]|nr:NADH-quinone oxidoreductase subunit NuoE [Deltaproteobacteria bacterium]